MRLFSLGGTLHAKQEILGDGSSPMFHGARKPFLHGNGPLVQQAESVVRPVKFGEPLKGSDARLSSQSQHKGTPDFLRAIG